MAARLQKQHRMPKLPNLVCVIAAAIIAQPARATELRPETAASFDRYIRAVEARMEDDVRQNHFLAVDSLSDSRQRTVYARLQRGELYVEPLHAREDDHQLHIQSGLLNHWVGVIFIPAAKLSDVISVLRDYDHHCEIYTPEFRQSKLITQHGDEATLYLQLYSKTVVTVTLNANFTATDTQFGGNRHQLALHSTRIAEVVNAEKPDEHELPVGNDHGYLWRFNTYWRLEEKDGGVYVRNESIALSRSIPALFAWLLSSLTNGIPRDILTHLLTSTRSAVTAAIR